MLKFIKECERLWNETEDGFPDWIKEISEEQRKANEVFLEEKLKQVKLYWNKFPNKEKENKLWKKKGKQWIGKLLNEENILRLEKLDSDMKESLIAKMQYFLVQTRKFDKELCLEDIGQAMRNFCICIIFGEMEKGKIGYEKAAWAYSLLYPYTDNLIDSTEIKEEKKKEFHKWLYQRLLGDKVKREEDIESRVSDLIEKIEEVYERESYKEVYQSILWIYRAQVESLKQQNIDITLTEKEVFDISMQKGGSSVLVDGFLINGKLSEREIQFYLEFGFLLQLADDLQDISEDLENCHHTLYYDWIKEGNLDRKLNKILQFLNSVIKRAEIKQKEIETMILENSIALLIISALQSSDYFSSAYLKQIEKYLPVSYTFLKKIQEEQKDLFSMTKEEESRFMQRMDILIQE